MRTRKPRRSARGFSMLEVLMAGAILSVGLTGIVIMLNQISGNTRDGTSSINASMMANQKVQEYQGLGFEGLVAQTFADAGADYAGRQYGQNVVVTPVATDAGSAFRIDVSVTWRDSLGTTRTNIATTIISNPDGG